MHLSSGMTQIEWVIISAPKEMLKEQKISPVWIKKVGDTTCTIQMELDIPQMWLYFMQSTCPWTVSIKIEIT
mgnify:CR=1 FL=1